MITPRPIPRLAMLPASWAAVCASVALTAFTHPKAMMYGRPLMYYLLDARARVADRPLADLPVLRSPYRLWWWPPGPTLIGSRFAQVRGTGCRTRVRPLIVLLT